MGRGAGVITTTAYYALLAGWVVVALVIFAVLLRFPAPYGRFVRPGWGPSLSSRVSWLLMEAPAVLVVTALFALSSEKDATTVAFCVIWNGHYVYRAFIYPWQLRSRRRVPVVVTASGAAFNVVNGFLQGWYLFHLAHYPASWLLEPRFWTGLAVFLAGLTVNVYSDALLRRLRRDGGDEYLIPYGGFFRWVSSPNYFGEVVEWTGWAVLTWSPPGAVFALWTAANLVPRALVAHDWYRSRFPEYPEERRAILPWIL